MAFISLEFIVLFPIVIAMNYLLKGKARIILLTLVSFYYYLSFAHKYAIFLLILIILAYVISYFFIFARKKIYRKLLLIAGISIVLGILFYFKYLDFVIDNFGLTSLAKLTSHLPLFFFFGISYMSFQIIGYLVDIYYERTEVERDFFTFALFISFFPKIISGPIERAGGFLQQLKNDADFSLENITEGLKMFIWGYFVKVVISDRLAIAVNHVFKAPSDYNSYQILVAVIFFTFQLYTDFMGYSFMALGSSRMLGFRLINNFHIPFFSKSISDFWKRWHISLSTWLRDYIFLPVSYVSVEKFNKLSRIIKKPENLSYIISTFITMTICGIWHGARWTFIIWGVIHSLYLIIGFLTKKVKRKALKRYNISNKNQLLELSRIVITFILITTAFVFFRSENIETAFLMFTSILSFNFSTGSMLFYNVNDLYFSFASILFLLAVEYIQYKKDNGTFQYQIKDMLSIPFLILLILLIIYFGKFGESDFIYFKF